MLQLNAKGFIINIHFTQFKTYKLCQMVKKEK